MRFRETFVVILLTGLTLCFSAAAVQAEGPFKLKPGAKGKLCLTCHTAFGEKMKAKHIHTPLAQGDCSGCHNPHASNHGMLLAGDADSICYNCHDSVITDGAKSVHQVVAEGQCVACHSPHASDDLFLQQQASTIDTCGQCHDWQTHSTHPIGGEVIDPRNPNLGLDCLSCHRTHGTEYKNFLYYQDTQSLCVQCHTKYRR